MAIPKWTVLLALLIVSFTGVIEAGGKVCYYGNTVCFDNEPPFNNIGLLPQAPEKVQTKFILYQPKDKGAKGTEISHTDMKTVSNSGMKLGLPLKLIVHGFCGSGQDQWIIKMKDAFISKLECNVVAVDWKVGAGIFPGGGCSPVRSGIQLPFYSQAVANTRLVGKEIEMLLTGMKGLGLNLRNVHIVGHSLGAHTAGTAGMFLKGQQLLRISGLDPASPNFEDTHINVRLDETDAYFVDVIHTDADGVGHLGLWKPSGHVDFYPNGGFSQPGCSLGGVGCSHSRAHQLYIASLQSGSATCTFPAKPCNSWNDFTAGKCKDCGSTGCSEMGYEAINRSGRGKMFLTTDKSWPFCWR